MKEFSIVLRSFEDVRAFVTLAMVKPFRIMVGSYNRSISAKNFMGMFSLDYSRPLTVSVDCDDVQFLQFRQEAARFLVA